MYSCPTDKNSQKPFVKPLEQERFPLALGKLAADDELDAYKYVVVVAVM
jgi:hypothetical protein